MLCTDSSCGGLWLYEEKVQYTGNYYCFCNTISVSVTTVTLDLVKTNKNCYFVTEKAKKWRKLLI